MPKLITIAIMAATLAATPVQDRPESDRAQDASRKPSEILAFGRIRTGDKVGEYMPGGGYFTRILAAAVGPRGHVYAYPPSEIVRLVPKYLTDARAIATSAPDRNITVLTGPNADFSAPVPLDVVFTAQNYHDLHTRFAPTGAAAGFNAAVFKALRKGGRYVIVDHSAPAGTGVTTSDRLHRIDSVQVRAEVEAAGFRFEGESNILANPKDPRTTSVFDPSIRGATDQFALKFRKP
jgi:predicted methyltransferase